MRQVGAGNDSSADTKMTTAMQKHIMAILLCGLSAPAAGDPALEFTPSWEYVADSVMGGVSAGRSEETTVGGRPAIRLTGTVSTENNGGFIQIAFDTATGSGPFDASAWQGIEIDVQGNSETYDIRLRTDQLRKPWHSYRASFRADPDWSSIRVPFSDFEPHRTDITFDPSRLRRIGILAIGREFQADIAISGIRLYR